ncbi:hypothetical protein L7F22_055723 [Adiantum nelumboides]|nr:hypothetical protein [Adiantum nelumboides]
MGPELLEMGGEVSYCLVLAYSNRCEAWMKLGAYDKALADSEEALKIDSGHVKSMARKGRALHQLGSYKEACLYLSSALKKDPKNKELASALENSKWFCTHGRTQEAVKGADLTAYLLGGCKSHDAPKCDEYVGPVEIRKSIDCHGRGLFVKSDVKAGELLLVSNALAMCPVNLDTDECAHSRKVSPKALKDVAKKVTEAAKTSWRLVQQLRTLCGGSGSTSMALEVPSMELFTQAWPPNDSTEGSFTSLDTDVNVDWVLEKVKQNFGVQRKTMLLGDKDCKKSGQWGEEPDCGLWLLPSFINHSCLSNASRLDVGETVFIHAARDMVAGEEVTLPHFETFLPLKEREEACEAWGFKCGCKRCTKEGAMRKRLRPVNKEFKELRDVAMQEAVFAGTVGANFPTELPDCWALAKLGHKLDGLLMTWRLNKKHAAWVRASYAPAYLATSTADMVISQPMFATGLMMPPLSMCMTSGKDLMACLQAVEPGNVRVLALVANAPQGERKLAEELRPASRDVCARVFGARAPEILDKLISLYSHFLPFP